MAENENEMQKLIDEVEVEGYKIRPWGIVQISRLSGSLERIFFGLSSRGVTLESATKDISKIIFAVLPEIPAIISETLNIPIAEVDKIPQSKIMPLVLAIINGNMVYLKNWYTPAKAAITEVTA